MHAGTSLASWLCLAAALATPELATAQSYRHGVPEGREAAGFGSSLAMQLGVYPDASRTIYAGYGQQIGVPGFATGRDRKSASLGGYRRYGDSDTVNILLGFDIGREGWYKKYSKDESSQGFFQVPSPATLEKTSASNSFNAIFGTHLRFGANTVTGIDLLILRGLRRSFRGCGEAGAPRTCRIADPEGYNSDYDDNFGGIAMLRTRFGNFGIRATNASIQVSGGFSF